MPFPHVKVEEEVQQLPKTRMKKQQVKASKEYAGGLGKLTSSLSITSHGGCSVIAHKWKGFAAVLCK